MNTSCTSSRVERRASPRSSPWSGFHVERLRAPVAGQHQGLYIVRAPDGQGRAALYRGYRSRVGTLPHRVHVMADGLIGDVRARYWPSLKDTPAMADRLDAVGEFRAALRFAFECARAAYRGTSLIQEQLP